MRTDTKDIIYDGMSVVSGGMDGGRLPELIGREKVAFACNVTFRGGYATSRPTLIRRTLNFPDDGTQTDFEGYRFQGAGTFEPFQGGESLMAMIGGSLFELKLQGDSFNVTDLSTQFQVFHRPDLPQSWFVQAEDFVRVNNGQELPMIYDGRVLRFASKAAPPAGEMGPGCQQEFANGRIWQATTDQRSFVAGDLSGSSSGTPTYLFRDAVLHSNSNKALTTGATFGVPVTSGKITALRSIANLDTSLGQGPMQVGTERAMFSVNAPFDSTTWLDLAYPIQTVSLLGAGPAGQDSVVMVNGDLWFRTTDGDIRSFQVARRDFGDWAPTVMSSEVDSIINGDDLTLLDRSSGVWFDNRRLETTLPQLKEPHGIVWRGLVVLDFFTVSGITGKSNPVWDGLWTGLQILKIIRLRDRCFLFTSHPTLNRVEVYELLTDGESDNDGTNEVPVVSWIETSAFSFTQNSQADPTGAANRVELFNGDLWRDSLAGSVNWDIKFRPDSNPNWIDWVNWTESAKVEHCPGDSTCMSLTNLKQQYRPRISLPMVTSVCNTPQVGMPVNLGSRFQARIQWTGHARLVQLRLAARHVREDTGGCPVSEAADSIGVAVCDTSVFNYSIE